MITTTYNYSSGSGFVYDAAKIGFVSNMAQLILVDEPGQTFVPTISASTYDAAILEYVGGVLRQKDQRPANATFYASWTSIVNGNWGNGSTTVTANNGASIVSSLLDLTGSTNKSVTFSAVNNAASASTGTIAFQFTPQYSGTPSSPQVFCSIYDAPGVPNSSLSILHDVDGGFYLQIYNSDASVAINASAGFSPTSGTTYSVIAKYNSGGSSSITVNGSTIVTTNTGFTRASSSTFASVGLMFNGVGNANFTISNFSIYSTVVTPSSFVLTPTIYAAATAILPPFTYAGLGDVQAFTACSITDSGMLHYTLSGKYWNGSAWVASNGSYAQANDAATLNTNISAFSPSDSLQVDAIYQAQSAAQGELGSLTLAYTGQIYPTTNPSISPNTSLSMDALSEFIAVLSASGSDGILFNLKIGAIRYWWSGSAWVVSNGTYAQSNTAADIQTNAGSLPIDTGAFVTPYALLHSADGTTTPMLTSLTLTYDYFGPEPSPPDVCKVFGYILDENEVPIVGATVSVTNETTFINGGIVIAQGVRTVKTNSFGYFSMNLVETATMPVPALLTFSVAYTSLAPGGVGPGFTPTTFTFGGAVIPDVPEANIASFTFQ